MGKPLRVGIIGVGVISDQYLTTIPTLKDLELIAVSDLNHDRAISVAEKYSTSARTVEDIFNSQDIDVVLNLTTPESHKDILARTLDSGKHAYSEKPLALEVKGVHELFESAAKKKLRIGCAPDTILGTGIQTARQLLDSGAIGVPVGAIATWVAPGHELWHPAPLFYYQPGAGPLFDMGPYYLTALINLLGPVKKVYASVSQSDRKRSIATGPNAGQPIPVNIETHVSAILHHHSGVTSTITVSFDVWATKNPPIEIFGSAGTISVPDPNKFSDEVSILTAENREWIIAKDSAGYQNGGRGIGLADMSISLENEKPHRASGDVAFHLLEIMESIIKSGHQGVPIDISSSCERPTLVPFTSLAR